MNNLKKIETDNGAIAYQFVGNHNLQLFTTAGQYRPQKDTAYEQKNQQSIKDMWLRAFRESPDIAIRNSLYIRDCRLSGMGEKNVAKILMELTLSALSDVKQKEKYVRRFIELGCWKDIMHRSLLGKSYVQELIKNQWDNDTIAMGEGLPISLLSKWLPTSGNGQEGKIARSIVMGILGYDKNPKGYQSYQREVARRRRYIGIVERQMCQKEWGNIDYNKLPSKAANIYRKAFSRNDQERYAAYLTALENRDESVKINTGQLDPVEIMMHMKPLIESMVDVVHSIYDNQPSIEEVLALGDIKLANAQWDSYLKTIPEIPQAILPIIDTSGSMMSCNAIYSAMALGLILSLKNSDPNWQGKWINFSTNPNFQSLDIRDAYSLSDYIQQLDYKDWSMSTDINKVFQRILNRAIKYKLGVDQMPNSICIISDMQFNAAMGFDADRTLFENISAQYKERGYVMPNLIFWNADCNARPCLPLSEDHPNSMIFSGKSGKLINNIISGDVGSPQKFMTSILMQDIYDINKPLVC